MLKKFIKIHLTILLVTLFCSILLFADSSNIYANSNESKVFVIQNSQTPLYNNKNEIVAYYFSLNSGGYIIVNSNGSDFIEYSLEPSAKPLNTQEKYYYSAPCSIYKKINNDKIENYKSKENMTLDTVNFQIEPKNICDEKKAAALATTLVSKKSYSVIEEKTLRYSTKKYRYNPDGRCGAVASAIFFRYYNDHVSTKYMADTYETSDGKKFINYLVKYFLGTNTSYSSLKRGLNVYLNSRNISSTVKTLEGKNSSIVFNKIKYIIKKNRPLIIGLTKHPTYDSHWVVGTGYSILHSSLGYSNIIIANDGWGNTGVRINLYYVDGCLYI